MFLKAITVSSFAVVSAGAANAAIDIHITGSQLGGWGVWVTGLFNSFETPGGPTHHALTDSGSGNPMDFMMQLPDGTSFDGSDVSMRMISADIDGPIGGPALDLVNWGLWITISDENNNPYVHFHASWGGTDGPLSLSNLGSSGEDGVEVHHYAASGFDRPLDWMVEWADGTTDYFASNFDSFSFSAPIPAPGAAALLGLAGLTAVRRTRR